MKSSIDGLTAWANVRLASKNCQAENILKDIMEGQRMKALLECITGSTSKRLDTLDGYGYFMYLNEQYFLCCTIQNRLTFNQKVIRVDWFVDALRASNKLPSKLKVDSKFFAMHSSDHVFPVLWTLVEHDVSLLRDLSSIYIKQPNPQVTIAEPFRLGPACHVKTDQPKLFYLTVGGESLINPLRKRVPPAQRPTAQDSLIELTHLILKSTPEGKRLQFNDISDLTDTRILCALVNTIIPGTFTSEVLLNDRWTINLALNCLSKIFRVLSPVDSETLTEAKELGSFPFIAYFLLCSYQFVQTRAVIRRLEQIEREEKDIQKMTTTGSREEKLAKLKDEREWILSVYDMELCSDWLKHAAQVQSEMRMKMTIMMKQRFDVVVVPRPMTINELVDSLFINLALTSQNGFYQSANKEKLWPKRRMVVRDKDTGEFYDDFSGSPSCQGSIRHMLGLSPSGVEDVKASDYAQFELYFESTSRNKILKAGSCFLYQVFPGSTLQCQRLTLQAAKKGDLTTIQKLVVFFRRNKDFVNSKDPPTGNTALHLASRYGHFDLAQYLLENGASVNCLNSSGCTPPLFCAVDGLHKSLCHLLLEWGADLRVRNNANMAAPDLVRNDDLRSFLEEKFSEYRELTTKALARNVAFFEQYLRTHCREGGGTASLRSRSIKGNTLLHQAVIVGSMEGVKLLLSEHVPVNITNHLGATPLHLARRIDIVQHLVECGGDVNVEDDDGNTPLHCICSDQESADHALKCIPFMVRHLCGVGHSDWGLGVGHSDWGLGAGHSGWGLGVGHSDWGLGVGHSDWGLVVGHSDWGLVVGHSDWGLGAGHSDWGLGVGHSDWGLGVGHSDWGLGVGHSDWGLGVGHSDWGLGAGHSDWGLGVWHSDWGLGVGHSGWGLGVGHSDWGLGVGHSDWGLGVGHSDWGLGVGHSDWGLGAGHSDWGLGAGHSDWGAGHSGWGLGVGHSDWGLGVGHSGWGLGVGHSDWGLGVGHSDWGLGAGHSGWGLGAGHSDWGLGAGQSDWGLGVGHSGWGLGVGHSDWGLGVGHSDWGLGAGHSDWGLGVGHSGWGLGVGHSGWGLGAGHSGWGLGVGHSGWGLGVGHSGWGLGVEKGCFLDTPNSQKQLPIHYAASCGLMAVIQSLMACDEGKGMMETLKHWQSEVMMSSYQRLPVHALFQVEPPPSLPYLALVNDHQECAEWLVESGFVMSGGEADDLLLMILKGPPEKCLDPIHAFQFLLKQGADPNAEYADGNRPLHLSSSLLMLPEITGLLLEAGADLNARNKQGFTPLFVACQVNNPYVANQLIVRGADYKCKDSSGMCALDYILDYEEWMDCSHFNDDMRARLKAYSLKQAKELVHSITVSLQRSEFRT
ncbi:hypothetical protein EMCRGX_G020475 [Ephydatia muelleri]